MSGTSLSQPHLFKTVFFRNQPFKALVDSGATTNFIALHHVSPLSLTPVFTLTSGIDSLVGKELVLVGQAKAYSFSFDLDSSPYTELFVGAPYADYNLVLGLPWLRKHNPDINWKKGTLTPRPDTQPLVLSLLRKLQPCPLSWKPTAVRATALSLEPMPHQDDEDRELWPLDVDSQDYADVPDDLYASEVYKQRLATEKVTFAGTTSINPPCYRALVSGVDITSDTHCSVEFLLRSRSRSHAKRTTHELEVGSRLNDRHVSASLKADFISSPNWL